MMKKRLMAALMAATMAMSLAACGGGDTAPAGGSDNASNEPYKIRMTLKTNAAEFWASKPPCRCRWWKHQA